MSKNVRRVSSLVSHFIGRMMRYEKRMPFFLGYFPQLFNRIENWNYVGDWPAVEYYQPEIMKETDRSKFMEWYNQQLGKQFDVQKELREYCESDPLISCPDL